MDTHEESTLLAHGPCDNCGSSDANAEYSDGHSFCFSCQVRTNGGDAQSVAPQKMNPDLIPIGSFLALSKRRITEETARKFGYSTSSFKGHTVQVANYKRNGQIIAQKIRFPHKDFLMLGNSKECGLFGQHLFREGGKTLTITEGEIDCLTASQAMSKDNKWPCVSIPKGAAGAVKAIKAELEFVSSFEKVVIMMDNDEAGNKAALEIAQLLKPSQAFIAELPAKDPSELMMAGRSSEIITAFWEAKPYRPDGIVQGQDIWDDIIADDTNESVPWPFEGLNTMTHGLRRGELVTLTAGSGVGKSQVCREIAHHLITKGETVGYVALEESVKRTALGLMGLAINKPLHISKEGVSDGELRTAFDDTVGSGRVYLYDHFGSLSSSNLLDKIRYLAKGCDVGWVVLDHLSIAVSGISAPEGERKAIDVLMTELRSIVEETGIGMILVSHLKRPEGNKGFEEGLAINLNSLRGSAAIAQLSDTVIGLERNQQSEDEANQVTVRVVKNRFSGSTGVATKLYFNKDTNRLSEAEFIQDEFNEY